MKIWLGVLTVVVVYLMAFSTAYLPLLIKVQKAEIAALTTELASLKQQVATLAQSGKGYELPKSANQSNNVRLVCKYSETNAMNCFIYSKENVPVAELKKTAKETGWNFIEACPEDFLRYRLEGESCLGIWAKE